MFKKFNYNLNHSPVGGIWGLSLAIMFAIAFIMILPEGSIISNSELIITLLSMGLIMNFINATYILFRGEIKQVNVTYVCPTARKYLSEKEINEIEKEEI